MLPELTAGFLKSVLNNVDVPGLPKDRTYASTTVFLLTFIKKGAPHLLAVLKADNSGYPWRNQVALPGGHIDKNDKSPLDAAYRELEEEVGISRRSVEYIGSLGHFQTIAFKDIHVFLGIWEGKQDCLQFDRQEISKILELPISDLLKIHISSDFFGRQPNIVQLVYPIQGVTVWGVTAKILHFFFELILNQYDASSIHELKGGKNIFNN